MNSHEAHPRGSRVVARTNRGLELGEVLCEASEHAVAQMDSPPGGSVQRLATAADENESAHLRAQQEREAELCHQIIRELELPMDLVEVERVFGGERLVVYYLSEDRVDFRDLVKRLASEFRTRIEMRQIGIRDEAKILADYGDCGKPVCCNTHLTKMPPVSMRMAKLQKATLDPNKISGRCGRLKCCLRYEFDTYEEHRQSMPRIGADIITNSGRGRVVGHELLSRQLLVTMEDQRRIMIRAEDVLTVLGRSTPSPGTEPEDTGSSDDSDEDSRLDGG
ncbi:MAG: signal peptidase [Pirellulaceae bacterium]|nr:signal peptidase [Pirellulaceae bacterium]